MAVGFLADKRMNDHAHQAPIAHNLEGSGSVSRLDSGPNTTDGLLVHLGHPGEGVL
jgi:hypothetical protein